MKIKQINWLSKEALEAEVLVTDNEYEILCFSHPFKYGKGDVLEDPLIVLDVLEIVKADENIFSIRKMPLAFEYSLTGLLSDRENGILEIGNLKIEISKFSIPLDIQEDDFISLKCSRIDIW